MARKSKEISNEIKQLVVDLKREGHRNCDIQRFLKISEYPIRSILKKFISTGNIENMPRSGRPRKMTKRAESRLLRLVRKNRQLPLRDITNNFNEGGEVQVHHKIVQKILYKNKIFRRVI